jgi:ABC-2 type transport system ATP-binding protein
VVLDKGLVVNDIKTSEATLKELEQYFAGGYAKEVG